MYNVISEKTHCNSRDSTIVPFIAMIFTYVIDLKTAVIPGIGQNSTSTLVTKTDISLRGMVMTAYVPNAISL